MKSTIRIDFEGSDVETSGFEPVIRVTLEDNTQDTRDKLLKSFFQKLGGDSSWLQVTYDDWTTTAPDSINKRITIKPVTPQMLKHTRSVIAERIGEPETILPSKYQIGDKCSFTTPKAKDYAFEQAKKANPTLVDDQIEYIPDYFWGKIIAVKFTEAKVWYDVLDDYSGKVFEEIPSHDVKTFSDEVAKQVVKEK